MSLRSYLLLRSARMFLHCLRDQRTLTFSHFLHVGQKAATLEPLLTKHLIQFQSPANFTRLHTKTTGKTHELKRGGTLKSEREIDRTPEARLSSFREMTPFGSTVYDFKRFTCWYDREPLLLHSGGKTWRCGSAIDEECYPNITLLYQFKNKFSL